MSWDGYVAAGSLAGDVFTESTASGYARRKMGFRSPVNSVVQGAPTSAPVTFLTTATSPTTINAVAFYTAVSGGSPLLVYPLAASQPFSQSSPFTLSPTSVSINLISQTSADGLALNLGGFSAISGLNTGSSITVINRNGITANGTTVTLPGDAMILGFFFTETAGHAVAVSVGTTNGGADVLAAATVPGSGTLSAPPASFTQLNFNTNQTLYVSSTAWNSASLNAKVWYLR